MEGTRKSSDKVKQGASNKGKGEDNQLVHLEEGNGLRSEHGKACPSLVVPRTFLVMGMGQRLARRQFSVASRHSQSVWTTSANGGGDGERPAEPFGMEMLKSLARC